MSQLDLFSQPSTVPSSVPSVDTVRARFNAMLARLRAAEATMPFTARELAYWQVVTPQMANWLPPDEREAVCTEFSDHMSRLRALLLDGASSAPTAPVDGAYFDDLRARVSGRTAG